MGGLRLGLSQALIQVKECRRPRVIQGLRSEIRGTPCRGWAGSEPLEFLSYFRIGDNLVGRPQKRLFDSPLKPRTTGLRQRAMTFYPAITRRKLAYNSDDRWSIALSMIS